MSFHHITPKHLGWWAEGSELLPTLPPGTSEGTVLVLSVFESGNKVDMTKQLEGHTAPISDMVANNKANQLVTADEEGTIILWQNLVTSKEPAITISDSRQVAAAKFLIQ